MKEQRKVAVLLFDEVEVLDFAGPFEVFSIMGQRDGPGAFNVTPWPRHVVRFWRGTSSV